MSGTFTSATAPLTPEPEPGVPPNAGTVAALTPITWPAFSVASGSQPPVVSSGSTPFIPQLGRVYQETYLNPGTSS